MTSSRITLLEVIRGDAAWTMINSANFLNSPPESGTEYALARLRFEYLKGKDADAQYDINSVQFDVVSSDGKDYGAAWGVKVVAAKCHAVEGAWRVVDRALEITGGFGIFPASGLERMFRDARLGRLHPANSYLTREILAKGMLGLDLDAQPR